MKKISGLLLATLLTTGAQAQLSVFTSHEVVQPLRGTVDSPLYQYEDVFEAANPYTGKVGLEYKRGMANYSGGYFYKSDTDLKDGNRYDYSGVFLRAKFTGCLIGC
ncbi:hypothetical protein ACI2I3_10140 [Psychrobacter namhaensis]|uniref:Uncharacterized protein n=1 Tax=Psychrobacter namhaensis TaxID=292734 RepID=A0ABW8L9U6_9GAMM